MQNFSQTPIFSDIADWYAYPAITQGDSKNIVFPTANGSAKAYITLQPGHYFMFCGFAAQTNYDNFGGVLASADADAVIGLPSVPNAFLCSIQRASSNNYANQQLTQAELCSSGLLSGKQCTYPVIYGPSQTFAFTFQDLTGFQALDEDDEDVPLEVQLWMIGYSIPEEMWDAFLNYFPALQAEYNSPKGQWTGAARFNVNPMGMNFQ